VKKHNIVLVSGGTGGHVIPAVNFGNSIVENGHNCYLLIDNRGKKYVSNFRGEIIVICSSHLNKNFFGKLKSLFFLLFGLFQAIFYLIKIRPFKSITFGSYASFMPLIILSLFKLFGLTHLYLHEQNSVMGKVNIFFSPIVNRIFLNFKETKKLKKIYKKKSFFVGLPKSPIYNYSLRKINVENNIIKRIFVFGGSQGAVNLNYKIKNLLLKINKECSTKIEISMQCPSSQFNELTEIFKKAQVKYELKIYYDNILDKLYQTDILIARAGAGTINDVIVTQIPTIFIPLPNSSDNHQYENAKYLNDKKAAILFEEKDLNQESTYFIFKELIENFEKRLFLIKNLQSMKVLDANKIMMKKIFE